MRTLPPALAFLALAALSFDLPADDGGLMLRPQDALITLFPADEPVAMFLDADRMSGYQDGEIEALGACELRRRGQLIRSDRMVYRRAEDEVQAWGQVYVEQNGNVTTGEELGMKLESRQGYMRGTVYRLAQPHARGEAERLEFDGDRKYLVTRGTYTTCAESSDDWFLRVRELELDRASQVGTAYHASMVFKGVPFMYMPWMTFPLNNQRQSGFLTPSFGSSGKNGAELSLPYYWNIAPDRDATITPRFLGRRGLQLSGEYRYLDSAYAGEARAEGLYNDAVTGQDRYALSVRHGHYLGAGWSAGLNVQKVSDDDYFRDLSTTLTSTSQTHLPREGVLAYSGHGLQFQARAQDFQTLQDPLAPLVQPYARLPQLILNGAWRDFPALDVDLSSEWVDFSHPTLVNGRRFTLYPSVSMPLMRSYAFLRPKIGLHATRYALGENNLTNLPDETRTLPVLSMDSGLVFERERQWQGRDAIQTLEPRLYYLYVPYRNQEGLPNFDSAVADFNYTMMFSENQFVGGDRFNDANQLTAALSSRMLDRETGQEWMRAAIGQRFYFQDQRVVLDGMQARTDSSSDLLAAFSGRVAPFWHADGGFQYNQGQRQLQKTSIGMRYQPETGRVLNLGYRYNRDAVNPIRQTDISAQWPFSTRWQGMGRWNYSFHDNKLLEGLAGLEYNGGCWAARAVIHRFATATAQTSDSIFFQLELFGMGKIGSSPLDILKRNISGYAQTHQTSNPATLHDPF